MSSGELGAWVHERLRRKWLYHAYRRWSGPAPAPLGWRGKVYWLELSSDYNDWFPVPCWGTSVEDAERQLEATLRTLGVERLMRRAAGADQVLIGFPRCPRCARLMSAGVQFFWRRVQQWRCDHKDCHYRIWTLDAFGHAAPPRPSALGAGNPYDVSTMDPKEG
ncbi:hypothetical protein EPO15_06685 [bacterium]|nr:MAG: hypothetical protein EPO15_06685 [bacterium]